jgi:hypothetical protein
MWGRHYSLLLELLLLRLVIVSFSHEETVILLHFLTLIVVESFSVRQCKHVIGVLVLLILNPQCTWWIEALTICQ